MLSTELLSGAVVAPSSCDGCKRRCFSRHARGFFSRETPSTGHVLDNSALVLIQRPWTPSHRCGSLRVRFHPSYVFININCACMQAPFLHHPTSPHNGSTSPSCCLRAFHRFYSAIQHACSECMWRHSRQRQLRLVFWSFFLVVRRQGTSGVPVRRPEVDWACGARICGGGSAACAASTRFAPRNDFLYLWSLASAAS